MSFVFSVCLVCLGTLGSSLDDLSARVEDLALSWYAEFEQYKDYQEFLSGSLEDFKLLISQSRTRRHYFPLVLGDKLEQLDRILASGNSSLPVCPSGSFSTPFVPHNGEPGRICVRSSRDIVSDFIKWDGYLEDCHRAAQQALEISDDRKFCDTIMDVGANIGACTLDFALSGTDFRVLAFEPNPFSFSLLSRSVALNNLEDRVTVLNKGISDQTDGSVMFIEPRENAGGSHRVKEGVEIGNSRTFTSTLVRLSEIISDLPCVQLLKLDCEGCERGALVDLYDSGQLEKISVVKVELTSEERDGLLEILSILSIDRHLFMYTVNGKRIDITSLNQANKLLQDNGIIDIYAVRVY